jgi:hypothetical protein
MSASTALPPLDGQNHDRDVHMMEDGHTLPNGNVGDTLPEPLPTNGVSEAVADDDAMDTTPDSTQEAPLPNGPTDSQATIEPSTAPPTQNGVSQDAPDRQSTSPAASETLVQPDSNGGVVAAAVDAPPPPEATVPPVDPPPPIDNQTGEQPPPPPPEPVADVSDSSDDDDAAQDWHPIIEDTSAPDENELKEIEEATEVSAITRKSALRVIKEGSNMI